LHWLCSTSEAPVGPYVNERPGIPGALVVECRPDRDPKEIPLG
jgi:hypothetical protein